MAYVILLDHGNEPSGRFRAYQKNTMANNNIIILMISRTFFFSYRSSILNIFTTHNCANVIELHIDDSLKLSPNIASL